MYGHNLCFVYPLFFRRLSMTKIVRVICRCRIHSRVLLDNGQSEKIPTANAVVGTFFDPHQKSISVNSSISRASIPQAEGANKGSKSIVIFKDCDDFIKETDKSIFAKKCSEKIKEGFELISVHTDYFLQQDTPNKFYSAKFDKKDNLS